MTVEEYERKFFELLRFVQLTVPMRERNVGGLNRVFEKT